MTKIRIRTQEFGVGGGGDEVCVVCQILRLYNEFTNSTCYQVVVFTKDSFHKYCDLIKHETGPREARPKSNCLKLDNKLM